jgi:hypothetical protein
MAQSPAVKSASSVESLVATTTLLPSAGVQIVSLVVDSDSEKKTRKLTRSVPSEQDGGEDPRNPCLLKTDRPSQTMNLIQAMTQTNSRLLLPSLRLWMGIQYHFRQTQWLNLWFAKECFPWTLTPTALKQWLTETSVCFLINITDTEFSTVYEHGYIRGFYVRIPRPTGVHHRGGRSGTTATICSTRLRSGIRARHGLYPRHLVG